MKNHAAFGGVGVDRLKLKLIARRIIVMGHVKARFCDGQVFCDHFVALFSEICLNNIFDSSKVVASKACGCPKCAGVGHNAVAAKLSTEFGQRDRAGEKSRFFKRGCVVSERLVIDDGAAFDDLMLVPYDAVFCKSDQNVDIVGMGKKLLGADPDLEKIVASADTRHIVLQGEDIEPASRQGFRESGAA